MHYNALIVHYYKMHFFFASLIIVFAFLGFSFFVNSFIFKRMEKKQALFNVEKGKIRAFKQEGLSNREIVQRISRLHTVVNNLVNLVDE